MTGPWTPGPWEVRAVEDPLLGDYWTTGNGHQRSANVFTEADARLIAAAPEMAELLEEVASWNAAPYGFVPLVDDARALLSRIRGEA